MGREDVNSTALGVLGIFWSVGESTGRGRGWRGALRVFVRTIWWVSSPFATHLGVVCFLLRRLCGRLVVFLCAMVVLRCESARDSGLEKEEIQRVVIGERMREATDGAEKRKNEKEPKSRSLFHPSFIHTLF